MQYVTHEGPIFIIIIELCYYKKIALTYLSRILGIILFLSQGMNQKDKSN